MSDNHNLLANIDGVLINYYDPYTGRPLLSSGVVRDKTIDDNGCLQLSIVLAYPAAGIKAHYEEDLTNQCLAVDGINEVKVSVTWDILSHAVQLGMRAIPEVKNIIAVASGKGGVGKSTVAANFALALAAEGANVGILDADIYGPSQPTLLGCEQEPQSKDSRSLQPVLAHGLQTMSIGYLVQQNTPMIWRGPMVSTALQQLLKDTRWQRLDYLIVDLPPGTGDIQLTLAQKIPVSGSIIVTTPQALSLVDVRKAIAMFKKVRVPILGIVENMSSYQCCQCGHTAAIFGEGGADKIADEFQILMLGNLLLEECYSEHADAGKPLMIAAPESDAASHYRDMARRAAAALGQQSKNYASKFPNIVVE